MKESRSPGDFSPAREAKKGANVVIDLKLMRHGEREGKYLVDIGRETTRERARQSGVTIEDYDAVSAIGSPADPNPAARSNMGRALETADIYAEEIAGDKKFRTRARQILNYENVVSPRPYVHIDVYNSYLPADFESLTPEEKVEASKIANSKTVKHVVGLHTPEAEDYKREMAGGYAFLIDHYQKVAKRLNPDSKVLVPAGTHGGMMEFLLQYALVRENEKGEKTVGLQDLDEIGGDFNPSEAFNVRISTDENGENKPLAVTFDNPARKTEEKMYLDGNKLRELLDLYNLLHNDK